MKDYVVEFRLQREGEPHPTIHLTLTLKPELVNGIWNVRCRDEHREIVGRGEYLQDAVLHFLGHWLGQ